VYRYTGKCEHSLVEPRRQSDKGGQSIGTLSTPGPEEPTKLAVAMTKDNCEGPMCLLSIRVTAYNSEVQLQSGTSDVSLSSYLLQPLLSCIIHQPPKPPPL
jgi:hypothetical protein